MPEQPQPRPSRPVPTNGGGPDLGPWEPSDTSTDPYLFDGYLYGDRSWDEMDDERSAAGLGERLGQAHSFPEPEDRGKARLSPQGEVEYVEDLIRPGRIVVVAAEEGTGKSYAIDGELAIRVALAGGAFAGTWPVREVGTVLVLSEMHSDDDYRYEETVLEALGRSREELIGGLYRLPLMTAAGGAPALTDEAWRRYITSWATVSMAKLMIFDTATGATQVEPWGKAIQEVFRNLRLMLEEAPQLGIVLIVHLKKPNQRGNQRAISDVMGEWGRWCDVLLLMESDGPGSVKLTSRKRVHQQRRVRVTQQDGLLVDPVDLEEARGQKVPMEEVIAAIADNPGIDARGLASVLKVTSRTARRYAELAEATGRVGHTKDGEKGAFKYQVDRAAEAANEAFLRDST